MSTSAILEGSLELSDVSMRQFEEGETKRAIKINQLRLQTILGVNESERYSKRPVVISAYIELEGSNSVTEDSIYSTIDYKIVRDRIIAEVEKSQFKLIESLADCVLRVLVEDQRVSKAQVEVDKPGALRLADSVSVCMSWERK